MNESIFELLGALNNESKKDFAVIHQLKEVIEYVYEKYGLIREVELLQNGFDRLKIKFLEAYLSSFEQASLQNPAMKNIPEVAATIQQIKHMIEEANQKDSHQ
jgi:hypothetical protein